MQISVSSPFPFEAFPRAWHWLEPFREQMIDDYSPQTLEEFVDWMIAMQARQKSWAVYGDDELGGMVTYQELTPWVGTAHFFLKSEFHRKRVAIKAARLVAAEIFDHERVGKLVFNPFAGNKAIGSLLINLGAKREGALTGHTLLHGKPVDIWLYGLTREAFNASSSNRGGDRGNQLDRGLAPIGKAEDADQHNDADIQPGDAGAHGPPERLFDVEHGQPGGELRGDPLSGPGPDQPHL